TLGRPLNYVTLPAGWMLTSVNTPAVITLDDEGRIKLRFTNTRNGDLAIVLKARKGRKRNKRISSDPQWDYLRRWRATSYITTAPATDTLSEGTLPSIGIFTRKSHFFRICSCRPCPSAPSTRAQSIL